jgi:hypothetical protein
MGALRHRRHRRVRDHGPSYIVQNQNTRPVQGQQLDVDWVYVLGILGSILAMQLLALVLLLAFANKSIIETSRASPRPCC